MTPESISFCEIPEIAILHHPTLSFGPFYFINFHAVLTSVKARSNSELVNPVCKATKHSIVILALPIRLYKIDRTIHMGIKGNPGPERSENGALSRNQRCPPCCSRQTSCSRKPLSVFYASARSIVNKRHLLDLELSKRPFDIIVLTETHLDDSISDAEIFPENYAVFRRDRSQNGRQGGGILIATSDFLNVSPRDDLLCDSELLFVDFHSSSRKILTLGVFYRPPKSNLKPLEDLKSALNNLFRPELVLIGDFNLSEFDWTNNTPLTGSEPYMLLTDIIQDNFLTQFVDQPTREGNILDLVLTSNEDLIDNLYVGEPFSDHKLVTFQLSNIPYVPRQTQRQVYSYKKADWTHLKSLLETVLSGTMIST